jgi:helix-turn-helix protein
VTLQIYRIIKARRLTQAEAGEVLGIRQPQVSLLTGPVLNASTYIVRPCMEPESSRFFRERTDERAILDPRHVAGIAAPGSSPATGRYSIW